MFILLIIIGFAGPSWLYILGAVFYIFFYLGLEILIVSAAIDAYFGYASGEWFMYTIATAIGLLIMQWVKPHLSVYNQ